MHHCLEFHKISYYIKCIKILFNVWLRLSILCLSAHKIPELLIFSLCMLTCSLSKVSFFFIASKGVTHITILHKPVIYRLLSSTGIVENISPTKNTLTFFFTKAQQCSKSEKMHISFDLIRKIHFIFIRWHLRKRKMALTMRVGIDVAFFNASQLKTRFQMNKFIQAYKVENRHTQRQTGLYLRFHCSSISPSISVQSFLKRKIETLEAFTNVKLCRLSCTSPAARKESLIYILKYLNMLVLTKSDLS